MGSIGKRIFDVTTACLLLLFCSPVLLALAAITKLTSPGPAIYWSDRVGANNVVFRMPKFRTMRIDTPVVATHLLTNPSDFVTPWGSFLRKFSLDELPQLWSVLKGDMSLVGPRPALHNQHDLIALRTETGVHRLIPGLTGWAQINGRDELPTPVKLKFDEYYLKQQSFCLDLRILCKTVFKTVKSEGVSH
jgi:O-antigen biosynthesis protein WbqP